MHEPRANVAQPGGAEGGRRVWWRRFGPGFLVTAAFIGPGTVTTATVAGDRFGLVLWWTVPFAVLTACVLQEMAARLGLLGGTLGTTKGV